MENKNANGLTRRKKQKIYYGNYTNFREIKFFPVIRIGGLFLKEYGFEINDAIEVNISMGKITISKVPRDYTPPADLPTQADE